MSTRALPDAVERFAARRGLDRDKIAELADRMHQEVEAYRLKELREASGLTQTDIAQRLGVSQARVSAIEHGDTGSTRLNTLRRYAQALGGRLRVEVDMGNQRVLVA
ncbi:MAG: helix-turn-helix domain-containing protein [Bifidobacteriaceae bacterium]|jgi:DNA-binding XRE family transcriptional regulator|nr:helix-turn-helix domain-containing protein [Bifidobacteriaceae bacterium]